MYDRNDHSQGIEQIKFHNISWFIEPGEEHKEKYKEIEYLDESVLKRNPG